MNPLLLEAWRGLGGSNSAQRTWLVCLACLAVVLVVWWPQREVMVALSVQRGPNTALALVIGLGVASAWYALALGAEEVRVTGQQTLRAWCHSREPRAPRVVVGLVLAQVLQTLHAFVLAAPLLVAAAMVSPVHASAIGWCLLGATVQTLWFRLAGANVNLAMGDHDELRAATVRVLFVIALAVPPFLAPFASHFLVTYTLLRDGANAAVGFAGLSVVASHTLVGVLVAVLLGAVLYWQVRWRSRALPD